MSFPTAQIAGGFFPHVSGVEGLVSEFAHKQVLKAMAVKGAISNASSNIFFVGSVTLKGK